MQWVKVLPDGSAGIEIDTDPTFSDLVPEAWFSVLVYIPSTAQTALNGYNPTTWFFLQSDNATLGIKHISGTSYEWSHNNSSTGIPVVFDQWVQVEWHALAGSTTTDFWLDGVHHTFTDPSAPTGINFFNAGAIVPTGTDGTDWVGYDELSYSLTGQISLGSADYLWSFETVDPLGDANTNYPSPPWNDFVIGRLSLETPGGGPTPSDIIAGVGGGGGDVGPGDPPDPTACCGDSDTLVLGVFIGGTDVTHVSTSGSWTPRLNRPAQATVTIPMDAAIGDVGDLLRIELGACIVFHGRILNVEVDTDKDGGRVQYNAQDAMEILQWRVVRDDDGDFSKPELIQTYVTGPQIIEAALINSVDSTGRTGPAPGFLPGGPPPTKAEGPLPIQMGGFAGGGPSLTGAPVDWPMRISELISLLISTGQVDVVMSPIDPGGGVTNRVDVYNGNYGTDRSGSVGFQYGTGAFNAASVRWNRDMTNVINKYWLYGGPQIQTAADPAGDQHWCFNVTGDDGGLAYPPGGANSPPASATNNQLGVRRIASQGLYDVRMQVDIVDGYDQNCIPHFGTPGRDLYRYQWQVFSWLAAMPREIIHITPVAGTEIGCFTIGDLIHVEAVSDVRGGFSGSQRVYAYTVSWEGTPSVLTLSEIQTSADNEGAF
jgi:hypothetical protein